MELRHLRYFAALAEHLSFTRAAEAVHVAQSTLSHQIRTLEEEVGFPLFERRGRSVRLTERGACFLPHVQRMLAELDAGLSSLDGPSPDMQESVIFASISSMPFDILAAAMGGALNAARGLLIHHEELLSEDIVARVQAGTLDFGVLYRPPTLGSFWFEPLYTDEFVLVVDAAHPLAERRHVRLAELHGQRLGILRNRESRSLVLEYFERSGIEPNIVVEVNKTPPLLGLVSYTDIATIAPYRSASLIPGNVKLIPLIHPTPLLELGLLWNRRQPLSRAAALMTHQLRLCAREAIPAD